MINLIVLSKCMISIEAHLAASFSQISDEFIRLARNKLVDWLCFIIQSCECFKQMFCWIFENIQTTRYLFQQIFEFIVLLPFPTWNDSSFVRIYSSEFLQFSLRIHKTLCAFSMHCIVYSYAESMLFRWVNADKRYIVSVDLAWMVID